MGGKSPEDDSSIVADPAGPRLASPLDLAWQRAGQRQAAAKDQQQQDVAAAVAAELNLVLRGKPYSPSVLRYATGHYAAARDVLLAHEDKRARRQAWQTWLEGYRETEDFQTVWALAKSITDSTDAHRQAVREAALLRQAQQAKARGGVVIALATEGDEAIKAEADYVIYVPEAPPLLAPIVNVVPLQLLSYHIAVRRGADVDQPRNLAKSVTVE